MYRRDVVQALAAPDLTAARGCDQARRKAHVLRLDHAEEGILCAQQPAAPRIHPLYLNVLCVLGKVDSPGAILLPEPETCARVDDQ